MPTRHAAISENHEVLFRRQMLLRLSLAMSLITALATIPRHLSDPMPLNALAMNGTAMALLLLTAWACSRRKNQNLALVPTMLGLTIIVANGYWHSGGMHAPVIALVVIFPILGFCFADRRLGILIGILSVLFILLRSSGA